MEQINKEQVAARRHESYLRRKDKHAEYQRQWREKNRDKMSRSQRNYFLKKEYGITIDDYDRMFEAQHGCCLICTKEPSDRRLDVDHDHDTGIVRGLLCSDCNSGIARLMHDPAIVARAILYLNGEL